MRSIKKKLMVKTVNRTIYDRVSKEEKVETYTISEVEANPPLLEGSILLDLETVSETEIVYSMSPETFVKYATVEK